MNPQASLSSNLVKSLEDLPYFILSFIVGFFIVAITDVIVTSLVLGCMILGILAGPLIALVVFFLGYTLIRTLNNLGHYIGDSGNNIAHQINTLSKVYGYHSSQEQP